MAGKELTWDDVVGSPEDILERTTLKEAEPHRGFGRRAYERFWGTDVDDDPLEFVRLGSQLAGGLGGAAAGAAAGGAIGSAVAPGLGTAVGAGLGAAIGGFAGGLGGVAAPEATMEAAEFLGIAEEGTRHRLGLSDKELETVVEGEAILDMLTGGGLVGARMAIRGAGRALVGLRGGGRKALIEFAAKNGVNLLPVQIGKREVPRGFVSVLGKFPFVAKPIRQAIEKSDAELKAAFEALPANIAPIATVSDLSRQIFMDAKDTVKRVNDTFKARYEDVYKQADHAGVTVLPHETVARVQNVLSEIARETPATPAVKNQRRAKPTAIMQDVQRFLANEIAPIFKKQKSGNIVVAPQSFRQMDTVLAKIDEKIAQLAKREGLLAEEAVDRLQRVRNAASLDLYTNAQGQFGKDVAQDLRAIDRQFTKAMADLVTVTAKKFGTVRRGGLSHLSLSDVPTWQSMDNLTDVLLKSGNVSELDELQKLVDPGTFRKLAAYSVHRQVEAAYTNGGKHLDLQELSSRLGIDKPKSAKFQYMKKMLEMTGGNMEDVQKLVEVGEAIGQIDAPNAATFVMRRGVIGGARSIVRTVVPAAGAGAVAGGAGLTNALIGGLLFIGGSRMVGKIVTDPRLARPLHKVLDKEVGPLVKKGAILQIGRIFANEMSNDGEFTMSESLKWRRNYEETMGEIIKEVERVK